MNVIYGYVPSNTTITVFQLVFISSYMFGLVVSMLAYGIQYRGFKTGRSLRIFSGEKILSMPSFGGEVKPSAPVLRQVKEPYNDVEVAFVRLNLTGHFTSIIPPFANIGFPRHLTWSASGDEWGN
jgi:hypothetical protein